MVYFFQAGVPFSIENGKFWPVLALLSRIYALFGAPFTGLNSVMAGDASKLTNIRFLQGVLLLVPRPERWIVTIPLSDQWLATIGNHWKTIATNGFWTPKPLENHCYQWFGDQKPLENHCYQSINQSIGYLFHQPHVIFQGIKALSSHTNVSCCR